MPFFRELCRAARSSSRFATLILLLLLVAGVVQAQILGETPREYKQRIWTREDGLPSNSIRAIHQTKDGFLWIATGIGLARFDGVRFKIFDMSNTPAFPRNECTALAEDGNGGLWVGTSKGLLRKHNEDWMCYTTQDSLWADNITALLGTTMGEVWIGTELGPVRFFDGEFKRFSPRGPFQMRVDEATNDFFEDQNGLVWIASVNGLQKWDIRTGSLTDEDLSENLTNFSKQLANDSKGNLWIRGRWLWKKDAPSWNASVNTQVFRPETVSNIFTDRSGTMWVAADGVGLVHWDDGLIFGQPKGIDLPDDRVFCMFEDVEGTIWVGTETSGLIQLRPRRFQSYTAADGLKDDNAWSICERRDGSIWIGTRWGINYLPSAYYPSEKRASALVASLRESAGRPLLPTNSVGTAEVIESEVIESTNPTIPMRKGDAPFEEFTSIQWDRTKEGAARVLYEDSSEVLWIGINALENVVRVILEGRSGEIWAGTQFGLYRWRDQRWSRYTTDDALPTDDVRAIAEDESGALWIGTFGGGLCRWTPPKEPGAGANIPSSPEARPTTASGVSQPQFRIITREIKDGESPAHEPADQSGGVALPRRPDIRASQQHSPTQMGGQGSDAGQSVVEAPLESDLQIGTTRVAETVTLTASDGLCDNRVSALHLDADGILWIGTLGGLNRLDLNDPDGSLPEFKIVSFTTENGLFHNTINQIVEDDFGQLWMGSLRGIFRVAKKELNAVAEGKASIVQCIGYTESDGLHSSEVNAGKNQPGAIKTRDGRLWFPTTKGVVVIDPRETCPTEAAPSVYIEQIRVNGKVVFDGVAADTSQMLSELDGKHRVELSRSETVTFPPGSGGSLEIQYTAPTFTAPRDLRFKYKLDGHDSEWREAGNQRIAHYTNLRPGSYRFQVIAGNYHGVWNTAGAAFGFVIAPHLYEIWWFRCAALLVVFGSGPAVYLRRVARLKKTEQLKRFRAVAEERERIARDMHDELGSQLSLLGMRCDLAKRQPPGSNGDLESLDEIHRLVRDAERSLDQIVWAVQPDKETLAQLADYLGQYANELLEPSQVSLRLVYPETIPTESLDVTVRHNLFLAAKEALRNAAQHSGASEIRVVLRVMPNEIQFEIIDNGIGLPAEDSGTRRLGNGLANMRKRIEGIGGKFQITNRSGTGTAVLFVIPRERAEASQGIASNVHDELTNR